MATILPFPVKKVAPIWGPTKQEFDAVQATAHELMLKGHVTGVSVHNEGRQM
jgi:hypothetical protein